MDVEVRMSVLNRCGCVLLCLALVSCDRGPGNRASSSQSDTDDRVLVSRAEQLAKSEIARLAAEALAYRSQAELHETVLPVVGTKVGVYLKMYREFTDYEIVDLVRSNSILYPVEIVIRFDFDVLATDIRGMTQPDGQEQAQADYRFRVLRRDSVTRRYRCDPEGNPADTFPELPRLKFYGVDTATLVPDPFDQRGFPFQN